jgi:hypothetical protein
MKFLIILLYIVFTYYASLFSYPIEFVQLWGHKTTALFDLWTLQHIATGIVIAYILTKIKYFSLSPVWTILLLSLFWESLELILELGHLRGLDGVVYQTGVEFWLNRSLTDPLAMIFGARMFRLNPKVFGYSVGFMVIWLLVNLYAHVTLVPVDVFIK